MDAATRQEAVRNASRTLAEVLETDDRAIALLASVDPLPDRDGYIDAMRVVHGRDGMAGLRRHKRLRLLEIAARDLAGELSLEEVGRALADLADACLQVTLEELEVADSMAVIGMGKLGGRELNYVSDIDVMFVGEGDQTSNVRATEALLRSLGEFSPEGRAYEIDANLRPEGRAGALVRSLDGYLEYYKRWAKEWEFQALIKARHSAGAAELGTALVDASRAYVFPGDVTPERIAEIRKMKERVEQHAQRSSRRGTGGEALDVKLGPGGIRDIEFAVQLLQLVHGGTDSSVRAASTLDALRELVEGGYVAEEDGAGLSVAYRWLRTVEHRLQLAQERRTHRIPDDPGALAALARVMGYKDTPLTGAGGRFMSAHNSVLADVRARFERLFYRPMIETLAEVGPGRLSQDALIQRLRVLGFRDAERAARTLDGLVSGTTRRAKIFRVLTPALLRFLSGAPLPDEGLFSFLRLGEALEARMDVLGAFRDNPPGLEFLATVLGSGRLLGEVLVHVPEELVTIADPAGPEAPKDRDRLVREAQASLGWREPERRLDGLRRFKRREMLRVALADLAGATDAVAVGRALGDLADACVEAAIEDPEFPFAVIGMGKLGGRELSYASDIDVMFVHDGDPQQAEALAERLMKAIGDVTPEGQAFRIDAALRPEGRSGPLARSIASYLEYYERWADHWERQALIKARNVAGDHDLGMRFVADTRRFPFGEVPDASALAEIRHLKARMEKERIPRGTDPRRNMKLGPGGSSDVEFAVQILQMAHAHEHPSLAARHTLDALDAAAARGLLDEDDAGTLADAYRFVAKLRNRLFFMVGRPTDGLPVRPEDLEALGVAMGFSDQPRQELEEAYLRITRRARRAAESLIYG